MDADTDFFAATRPQVQPTAADMPVKASAAGLGAAKPELEGQSGEKRKVTIKPEFRLVILVVAVAVAVYLLYHFVFAPPPAARHQGSGMLSSIGVIGRQQRPLASEPVIALRKPTPPAVVSPAADAVAPVAAPVLQSDVNVVASAVKAEQTEVTQALDGLKASHDADQKVTLGILAQLQVSVQALSSQVAALQARQTSVEKLPALATKRKARVDEPRTREGERAHVRPAGRAMRGLRLNTVYPGQAWIDAADGTHIVGVGDTISGARVLSIDAEHRVVTTTAGVIR